MELTQYSIHRVGCVYQRSISIIRKQTHSNVRHFVKETIRERIEPYHIISYMNLFQEEDNQIISEYIQKKVDSIVTELMQMLYDYYLRLYTDKRYERYNALKVCCYMDRSARPEYSGPVRTIRCRAYSDESFFPKRRLRTVRTADSTGKMPEPSRDLSEKACSGVIDDYCHGKDPDLRNDSLICIFNDLLRTLTSKYEIILNRLSETAGKCDSEKTAGILPARAASY